MTNMEMEEAYGKVITVESLAWQWQRQILGTTLK